MSEENAAAESPESAAPNTSPEDGQQHAQAQFGDLQDDSIPNGEDVNLEVILDVSVTLALEVGRSKMSIRELLQLTQGSVVELDRLANEPMDVLVNGTLVAHGEIVVVNENFGIRLTDVISPAERVKKLNG
jgi:flagellar motor switch protein FliN/FliY